MTGFSTKKKRTVIIFSDTVTTPLTYEFIVHCDEASLINIVQSTIKLLNPSVLVDSTVTIPEGQPQSQNVVECQGCGATVIVHAGQVNQCEYCDRYVE